MKEEEQPFMAECIRKIMDIMRNEEEFYLQEAAGTSDVSAGADRQTERNAGAGDDL